MTDRHLIAYGLIALIVVALGAVAFLHDYRSHRRTYARQRNRQRAADLLQQQARGD